MSVSQSQCAKFLLVVGLIASAVPASAGLISQSGQQAAKPVLAANTPPPGLTGSVLTAQSWFTSNTTELGRNEFEPISPSTVGVTSFSYTGGSATMTSGASVMSGNAPTTWIPTDGRYNMTLGLTSPNPRDDNDGNWIEATSNFDINFTSAVSALAFFVTDLGDFDGTLQLNFFSGNTLLGSKSLADDANSPGSKQNGNLVFFGMTSDSAFDRVQFVIGQLPGTPNLDVLGFDSLVVGTSLIVTNPTPEPLSLALVGLGLAAAGFAGRRRKA